MSDLGLYLYCLAPADLPPEAIAGDGLDEGGPLFLQRHGRIAAVVSEVRTDEFTGPESESRLQGLAWLTPRVLRHEEVVEHVLEVAPVVPARFATLFSSVERLQRLLEAHHDEVAAFLDRTRGTREWSVKLYLDRGRAMEKLVEDALASSSQLSQSPGTRYMQERRLRAKADDTLRQWLEETSETLYDALAPRALESARRRPLTSTSPDNPGEMVANWAFLVPNEKVEAFRGHALDQVRPFADQGLTAEFAGPFPPYSFIPSLPEPGEQPGDSEAPRL